MIDDREARRCARTLNIPVIGTLGLVLLAKQLGRAAPARWWNTSESRVVSLEPSR